MLSLSTYRKSRCYHFPHCLSLLYFPLKLVMWSLLALRMQIYWCLIIKSVSNHLEKFSNILSCLSSIYRGQGTDSEDMGESLDNWNTVKWQEQTLPISQSVLETQRKNPRIHFRVQPLKYLHDLKECVWITVNIEYDYINSIIIRLEER